MTQSINSIYYDAMTDNLIIISLAIWLEAPATLKFITTSTQMSFEIPSNWLSAF